MKKLILYYNFILLSIMTLAGFLGAGTFSELFAAVLFFPLAVYFGLQVVPRRNKALVLPQKPTAKQKSSKGRSASGRKIKEAEEGVVEQKREFDIDRRAFLKVAGSAGLTLFFFAMFTKRAHAAFFGSVPGPGTVALKDTAGTQIDPAQHHPTEGYKIAELDDATPSFYGFTNKDGAWYIIKQDSAGAFRYAKGTTGFSTNWTNRASLTYDYYDAVF